MPQVEYLDVSIANEGQSANNWSPGSWVDAPTIREGEFQPELEEARVNDYSALKKSKKYAKYFRPHIFRPFPCWLYHATEAPKMIDVRQVGNPDVVDNESCKREVIKLGPAWRREPYPKDTEKRNLTGKSSPTKSDTQRLTEALVSGMAAQHGAQAIDPNAIAAVVAATLAALKSHEAPKAAPVEVVEEPKEVSETDLERMALLELADKNGIKIDKRWGNERLREAVGL